MSEIKTPREIERIAKDYWQSIQPKREGNMQTDFNYRPTMLDVLNAVVYGYNAHKNQFPSPQEVEKQQVIMKYEGTDILNLREAFEAGRSRLHTFEWEYDVFEDYLRSKLTNNQNL